MQAEYVPQHQIGVLDCPVLPHEVGQAAAASRMVHVLAGREPLFGVEGRDPDVVSREPGPTARETVGMHERRHGMGRLQPVANWRADPVGHVWIDNLPIAHRRRLSAAAGLEF